MLLNQIIIQDSTIYVVNQKYIYGYISREENLQYKERVVCSLQKWTTSWPILRYHSSVKERKGQSFVFAIYLNVSTNSLAMGLFYILTNGSTKALTYTIAVSVWCSIMCVLHILSKEITTTQPRCNNSLVFHDKLISDPNWRSPCDSQNRHNHSLIFNAMRISYPNRRFHESL